MIREQCWWWRDLYIWWVTLSDEDKEDHAEHRLTFFLQLGIADIAIRCRSSTWKFEACWSLYLCIFLQSCFQVNLHCPRSAPLEFSMDSSKSTLSAPQNKVEIFRQFPFEDFDIQADSTGCYYYIYLYIFFVRENCSFWIPDMFLWGSIQGLCSMCFFIFGICCFSWIFHLDLFFFSLVFLHEFSFWEELCTVFAG